jgi:MoaA/NifB/PqqE/SkfB family radical SAM enzyme
MDRDLNSWKLSEIREKMEKYRLAQENYYIKGRPVIHLENGQKVFSLVSPPLKSPAARRRVRLIVNNMQISAHGSNGTNLGIRAPHIITIAVTYSCQCKCKHCSASTYQEHVIRSKSGLCFKELRSAIEQSVALGTTCVILTGGEPLLYGDIYNLIRSVDPNKSVCTMFTNGELLDEEKVLKLQEAGLFGLYVSIDHPDPERHDANRQRPGLFAKAMRGLEICRKLNLPTGISTFTTKEKLASGELDRMMELGKKTGVLEVFIFDVTPTGKLLNQHQCVLTNEEIEQVREFRNKYNDLPQFPRIVHQTMFSSMSYPCAAEGCPAALVQMHLRANGDVSPCDFTPYSFGNIRNQSLEEIWRNMTACSLYSAPSSRCRLARPEFWEQLDQHATTIQ